MTEYTEVSIYIEGSESSYDFEGISSQNIIDSLNNKSEDFLSFNLNKSGLDSRKSAWFIRKSSITTLYFSKPKVEKKTAEVSKAK